MLKSEVKNLSEKKELPFPKLMIGIDSKTIIFAIGRAGGTIQGLVLEDKFWRVGYYSEIWTTNLFTDFYGSVTLTQTPE